MFTILSCDLKSQIAHIRIERGQIFSDNSRALFEFIKRIINQSRPFGSSSHGSPKRRRFPGSAVISLVEGLFAQIRQ